MNPKASHLFLGVGILVLVFLLSGPLPTPTVPGTATRGQIRLHKTLAWIHGPGMILTPILGAMAFSQENNGERVHGIAKAHSAVATVTYVAFGLAVASVTIKF
jgi:hypothetical protein